MPYQENSRLTKTFLIYKVILPSLLSDTPMIVQCRHITIKLSTATIMKLPLKFGDSLAKCLLKTFYNISWWICENIINVNLLAEENAISKSTYIGGHFINVVLIATLTILLLVAWNLSIEMFSKFSIYITYLLLVTYLS